MAFLVALIVPIAVLLSLGCGTLPPSLIDSSKGNRPYDQEADDEPIDLREGKPVYIWPVASPDGSRIVFVSNRDGNTELYVMNADGTNPVNLTRNRAEDGNGSYGWSPDGRQIVFSSRRRGNWDIYVVSQLSTFNSQLKRLTDSKAQDYNPVWSPIISGGPCAPPSADAPMPPGPAQSSAKPEDCFGQWLAFTSNRSGTYQIYRMHPDGTGLEALTDSPKNNDAPVYSPDGRQIAFISDRNGSWDIFRMPSEGGVATALTDDPSDEDHPRWSSDGSRIIFESDKDGNWDVYTMRPDGTDLVRLTQTPAAESSPVFSPDMRQVAFASYRDGNPEIYVMDADGSNQMRLTFDPEDDICPTWSPDGTKIYFSSNRRGREEIYAIRMADHREILVSVPAEEEGSHGTGGYFEEHPVWSAEGRRITFTAGRGGSREGPARERYTVDIETGRIEKVTQDNSQLSTHNSQLALEHPVTSHDGQWIAFESNRDGNWEIYIAASDGLSPARLTTAPGADIQPAWSPDDRQIAFTSHRDGASAIYVMDRGGRNARAVVRSPSVRLPAWSPDGKHLYFVADGGGRDELYRMDLATGKARSLTRSQAKEGTRIWHPTVSPDGRWVAYVTNVTGEYRVWISDPMGSVRRMPTKGLGKFAIMLRRSYKR